MDLKEGTVGAREKNIIRSGSMLSLDKFKLQGIRVRKLLSILPSSPWVRRKAKGEIYLKYYLKNLAASSDISLLITW